jgi:pimeloyl-ACP methyl ester carboxylesterase
MTGPMATPTPPRDVVLIHSTGQGAAGWERVVPALGGRGLTAHAVELPSDPELLAADYAELIRRQVGAVAGPIVLAHSGAGPLLPATALYHPARLAAPDGPRTPGRGTVEIPTGHCPNVSRPDRLAELLVDVAARG